MTSFRSYVAPKSRQGFFSIVRGHPNYFQSAVDPTALTCVSDGLSFSDCKNRVSDGLSFSDSKTRVSDSFLFPMIKITFLIVFFSEYKNRVSDNLSFSDYKNRVSDFLFFVRL